MQLLRKFVFWLGNRCPGIRTPTLPVEVFFALQPMVKPFPEVPLVVPAGLPFITLAVNFDSPTGSAFMNCTAFPSDKVSRALKSKVLE